ncbi:hypothetical protein HK414_14595 [Ramlibacter terrae]|uniref:Uncharacterized protein n=1 Tax=Ramlibacter terrae TaxID=2732511 RepID=A0ABX6P678_9BURK|nr:hypothetical protein HK414_14595 [Ramlibacter terrae]
MKKTPKTLAAAFAAAPAVVGCASVPGSAELDQSPTPWSRARSARKASPPSSG